MSGAGNPFWGRDHSAETKAKIAATKRASPTKKRTGPPKGYKHTSEARAKIKEASRKMWLEKRDKMLDALKRSGDTQRSKLRTEPRYRIQFTPMQRRDWKCDKCAWCLATEDLVLDHIIPVMAGGKSERYNAQTLCRPCNLWKMRYVDLPYYLATLGSKEGLSG